MVFFLAVAFALLPGASTIPWAGPDITPTNKPHPAYEGWSPATTGLVGAIAKGYKLFKRQEISTCGYISGTSCKLYEYKFCPMRLTSSQLVQLLAQLMATSALPMPSTVFLAAARAPTSSTAFWLQPAFPTPHWDTATRPVDLTVISRAATMHSLTANTTSLSSQTQNSHTSAVPQPEPSSLCTQHTMAAL